jgi:hypothetical protein
VTKTQRLKYCLSIPTLLDTIERDSASAALYASDMNTRMHLGESQSSVESSDLAARYRAAYDKVRQAKEDMMDLFREQRDGSLEDYRAIKRERDDLLTLSTRLEIERIDLLALSQSVVETATLCRDCDWNVLKGELVELLTGLERDAEKAIAKAGGAK